jgi:hypothetical protein
MHPGASLEVSMPALFTYEETGRSPRLEVPETGLRINAEELSFDGGVVRLRLLVACCVPRPFHDAFQHFLQAPVVAIESAHTGCAFAARLSDPWKRYRPRQGPNYRGGASPGGPATRYIKRWINADLEFPAPPAPFEPSVFLTVMLQEYRSNTLGLDLSRIGVVSYVDGTPSEVAISGLPDDE